MTDESIMPFGKFKGKKMADVHCSYYHYLWNNGMKSEDKDVANYIRENLESLKQEKQDLIWDEDELKK